MRVRRRLRRLKRLAILGAATGTVIAVRRATRRSATPPQVPPAPWPPLEPRSVLPMSPDRAISEGQNRENGWVEPVDGACPVSHPVKVNTTSGIYHLPGGRFYDRTRPQRCYSDPTAAEADGYRAAKGS